jgi:hypothetical protein
MVHYLLGFCGLADALARSGGWKGEVPDATFNVLHC